MKFKAHGQKLRRALAFVAPVAALFLIGRCSPTQSPLDSDSPYARVSQAFGSDGGAPSEPPASDGGDVLRRRDGGTYCGDGGSGFPEGCIATLGPLTVAGILAPLDGGSLNPDGELLPDGGNPLNGIQVSIYCMLYDEGYCSGNTLFTSEWSTPSTPGPNGVVQVSMPEALTTGMNCTCPKSIFCSVRTTGSCGPAQYTTFCRPLNDPNHLTPDLSPLVVGPLWVDCPPLTPDAGTPDAGTEDAGTPDAGTEEPGTEDAGTEEPGTEDAGMAD